MTIKLSAIFTYSLITYYFYFFTFSKKKKFESSYIFVKKYCVESTYPINFLQLAGNIIRRRETSKTHEFAKCNRSNETSRRCTTRFRALPPAVFAPGQGARHSAGIMYRHRTWPCSHSRASSSPALLKAAFTTRRTCQIVASINHHRRGYRPSTFRLSSVRTG